jgi:hypothetical protein
MRSLNHTVLCVLSPETLSVMRELGKLTSNVVKRGGITSLERAHFAVCCEHILTELEAQSEETNIYPTPESESSP